MPFGLRRFTLQRSYSTESGGAGPKLPKSKSHDAHAGGSHPAGHAAVGQSVLAGGPLLPASRSVDQADLRRLGDPPGYSSQVAAMGHTQAAPGAASGVNNHHQSAGGSQATIQPPRLPPRGPPRRSASVDRANPPSQGK